VAPPFLYRHRQESSWACLFCELLMPAPRNQINILHRGKNEKPKRLNPTVTKEEKNKSYDRMGIMERERQTALELGFSLPQVPCQSNSLPPRIRCLPGGPGLRHDLRCLDVYGQTRLLSASAHPVRPLRVNTSGDSSNSWCISEVKETPPSPAWNPDPRQRPAPPHPPG
jgi:hypothetical protein